MDELFTSLPPLDDLPWWLVATLAARLWRSRESIKSLVTRLSDAFKRNDAWKRACKERDRRIAELIAENEAERARTNALHIELIALNDALNASPR